MLMTPDCESLCVGSMGRRGGETEESGEGRCLGYRPVSLCVSDLWEERGGETEESGEGRCLGYRPVSLCVSDLWEEGGERQKSQERGDA